MRTSKNTFMKVLGMVAIALTLVSCGKDNSSGNGSNTLISGLGSTLSSNGLNCPNNVGRTTYTYTLTSGSSSVTATGITCIGDIVVVSGSTVTVQSCNTTSNVAAPPTFYNGLSGQISQYYNTSGVVAYGVTLPVSFTSRGYTGGSFIPPSTTNIQYCQNLRSYYGL